jgi:PGF-CTERM protein
VTAYIINPENTSEFDGGPLEYDSTDDRFADVIDASRYPSTAALWRVEFVIDGREVLALDSHFTDNEFLKFNNTTVSGTIVDPSGAGVDGAALHFYSIEERDGTVTTSTKAVTAGDGTYSTSVAPATDFAVVAFQDDLSASNPTLPKDDVADVWPFGTVNFTQDVTGADGGIPKGHTLNVTVVSAHTGDPIRNATVVVTSYNNDAHGYVYANTTAEGVFDPAFTEGPGVEVNGTVGVEVLAPDGTLYEDTTRNVNVTGDTDMTVEIDGPARIVGDFQYANGTAAEGFTTLNGAEFLPLELDSTGAFDTSDRSDDIQSPGTYHVTYYQAVNDTSTSNDVDEYRPHDGNPDLVYTTSVTDPPVGTTDVGTQTLPYAHVVNVTVVDRSGDPVRGAAFEVSARTPNGERAGGWGEVNATRADGAVVLSGKNNPGIELDGDYSLRAAGPINSTAYAAKITEENVSVSGERNVTLTVNRTDVSPRSHDFGSVAIPGIEQVDVTVTNDGDFTWETAGATVVGADSSEFAVVAGGGNVTLEPGQSHTVTVEFSPDTGGSKTAALRFENPGPSAVGPLKVPLSGEATETSDSSTDTQTPTATATPTPTATSSPTATDEPDDDLTDTPSESPDDTPTEDADATATSGATPTGTAAGTTAPGTDADDTDATDSPTPTTTGTPGFGVLVAFLALLAALVVVRRRD